MQTEPMCYPEHNWTTEPNNTKPKTIVIADSFYWSMFNLGLSRNSFSLGEFWYYNKQIYPESFKKSTKVNQIKIRDKIAENDVFILMVTEANLPKFSWGFTENAVKSLKISVQ